MLPLQVRALFDILRHLIEHRRILDDGQVLLRQGFLLELIIHRTLGKDLLLLRLLENIVFGCKFFQVLAQIFVGLIVRVWPRLDLVEAHQQMV